ncbi:MAG: hypothetical protein GC181_13390 [Bacteroidetes bacterium]|nr:hypothetical protein [Bacteroidota bacterium]
MSYSRGQITGRYNGIPLPRKSFSDYTGTYNSYGLLPNLSINYRINAKLNITVETNAVLQYRSLSDSRYSGPTYSGRETDWRTYWNSVRGIMLFWTL